MWKGFTTQSTWSTKLVHGAPYTRSLKSVGFKIYGSDLKQMKGMELLIVGVEK
jgi:hypothetical protein